MGIMSDVSEQFKRWGAEGKYLAGCEVKDDATAPDGWMLWRVPAQTYVAVSCNLYSYGEALNYILNGFCLKRNMN